MNITFKRSINDDIKEIANLILDSASFLKEIDFYDDGWDHFIKTIKEEELAKHYIDLKNEYYGAYDSDRLVGIICFRRKFRVNQLFVNSKYRNMNIGRKLIKMAIDKTDIIEPIKVNSSSFAFEFYKSCGFRATDGLICSNGCRFYPMELNKREFIE